jgi:2-iminobutanoate/2-iminopropanoate deaminase
MRKEMIIALLGLVLVVFLLRACTTGESRVREIVREELAAVFERTPIPASAAIGPYSAAVRVGKFLFVSGQIALNPQTMYFENASIESETHRALKNLSEVLRKAGFDSLDIVATTVYLRDIADYAKMNEVYATYFAPGDYPSRTTVQIAALPRDARVEISAIAYRPDLP